MKLYLVRHPRPRVAAGVCYGRLDVPLAEPVEAAAARVRSRLPADLAALPLFTSPARRCLALSAALHPRPRVDARLQEMDFGTWEGQSWTRIGSAALDAWAGDPAGFVPPGGESARDLQERALAFTRQLVAEGIQVAVCVTHGGVLRVLSAWRHALPPERWASLDFACESVCLLEWHPIYS
ncbi:MAG: alpha-ribazole phosphatase family protein [Zoogloeaceae bacterium]|jgi:alpha-ribazole phosphatase|nr:alpha-ribazole phosphatase family protein [Zoogloeaceae bacterium]